MKISISGSQCTGKTTLIQELKKQDVFKDYFFAEEVVRSLKRKAEEKGESFAFNKEYNKASQDAIFQEHINNLNQPNLIADRSLLDSFVYTTYGFYKGDVPSQDFINYEQIFLKYIGNYDVFVFLPISFGLIEDGVRSDDKKFREEIQDIFYRTLASYSIFYVSLDSIDNRTNEFLKVINEKKQRYNKVHG